MASIASLSLSADFESSRLEESSSAPAAIFYGREGWLSFFFPREEVE